MSDVSGIHADFIDPDGITPELLQPPTSPP
jgi:hypothetical protein